MSFREKIQKYLKNSREQLDNIISLSQVEIHAIALCMFKSLRVLKVNCGSLKYSLIDFYPL